MNIAIIPARGGSKRIPRKNIRLFCGKPIINYSIENALNSRLFSRTIVSTDDPEIAEAALAAGAEVPFFRPRELANDFAGTNEVVQHAVQQLHDQGQAIEYVCCLYATAPLLTTDDLRRGFEILVSSKCAFAFSIAQFEFPIQRALNVLPDGKIRPAFASSIKSRSQDLEPAFHDAGQFYWGTGKAFLDAVDLYGTDSMGVLIPSYRVQDIDTEDDWLRAELMYKSQKQATGQSIV